MRQATFQDRTHVFAQEYGRRPRILLAEPAEANNGRDLKIIALAFADAGFDVDISPSGLALKTIARIAVENDVHGVALLFFDQHLDIETKFISLLEQEGADDIQVIVAKEKMKTQRSGLEDWTQGFVQKTLTRVGG